MFAIKENFFSYLIQKYHDCDIQQQNDMQKIIKSKLVTISSKHDKMYKKFILIRNI